MFNTGSWKQKAGLMALGSVFTIIGMLFAIGMLPSVTAQRDKFGDIECTGLTVVDASGQKAVVLDSNENGGSVNTYDTGGNPRVSIWVDVLGGRVNVYSSKDPWTSALLYFDEYGGHFTVYGNESGTGVELSTDEHGGRVEVVGKLLKQGAVLCLDEHGGRLDVFGKLDDKNRAIVGINKYGHGIVNTWKKSGERFHTLGNSVNLPSAGTTAGVIESKVDGTFEGWDGETIVKLMNGQMWKQSGYYYKYHYAYMPEVLIFKSGGRYKMLVEGIDKAVYVEKLK